MNLEEGVMEIDLFHVALSTRCVNNTPDVALILNERKRSFTLMTSGKYLINTMFSTDLTLQRREMFFSV